MVQSDKIVLNDASLMTKLGTKDIFSSSDCDDLDGHRITMEFMHGGTRIPLSVIRLYGMGVISNMTLDMY